MYRQGGVCLRAPLTSFASHQIAAEAIPALVLVAGKASNKLRPVARRLSLPPATKELKNEQTKSK
jgi:hypothetical protein